MTYQRSYDDWKTTDSREDDECIGCFLPLGECRCFEDEAPPDPKINPRAPEGIEYGPEA